MTRERPRLDGPLAIAEEFGERAAAGSFPPVAKMLLDEPALPYERAGSVAIVTTEGPLLQRGGWFWDGHAAIQARLLAALEDRQVVHVAHVIDSPGGVVAGAFDAWRAVAAAKKSSGKGITTFARESALSAGYGWACVGDEIFVPDSGFVASVGVISMLLDMSKSAEAAGVKPFVIRSGARKAEGHPLGGITAEALAAEQGRVDALAGIFADFVARARGTDVGAVLAHEGAYYLGAAGVKAGFADGIMSYGDFLAHVEEKGRKKRMKTMLTALGLSAEASEDAGRAAIESMRAKSEAAEKRAADAEARATKAEADVATVVDRAAAVICDNALRDRKIVAAEVPELKASVAENRNGPVAGLERLDKSLAARSATAVPPALQEPRKAPARNGAAEEAGDQTAGKTQGELAAAYKGMTNLQRAELGRTDPVAFERMRNALKNSEGHLAN